VALRYVESDIGRFFSILLMSEIRLQTGKITNQHYCFEKTFPVDTTQSAAVAYT